MVVGEIASRRQESAVQGIVSRDSLTAWPDRTPDESQGPGATSSPRPPWQPTRWSGSNLPASGLNDPETASDLQQRGAHLKKCLRWWPPERFPLFRPRCGCCTQAPPAGSADESKAARAGFTL